MTMFLTIAVIVLIYVVIFQIAKASEYVSVLKGEETSRRQNNKINGFLMVAFLVLGMIGVWYCNKIYLPKTLLAVPSASVEGARVDSMLWITIGVTGIVFIATQAVLFWFAYKYQDSDRKVFYFPHNNKLEVLWTIVPAIVLTVLVVIGLRNWFLFTGEPKQGAMVVEVTGKQFSWIFRYPGKDAAFGKKYFKNIDDAANNLLGIIWDDQLSHDDVVTDKLVLVKGKPVKLIIGSRDVIHDVGLSHFRMKMDAVPGIPTTMWFTPAYTTKEMKEITKNPNFVYEISCDQMCGNNHFSMRGIIEVIDQEEYDVWMAKQKPTYLLTHPDLDPENKKADSTKLATKPADTTAKPVAKL
ncbi:MAG: cytochrome c oxidase subunit II [Bacteroidota bacterium]